jgi:hypothetical protein
MLFGYKGNRGENQVIASKNYPTPTILLPLQVSTTALFLSIDNSRRFPLYERSSCRRNTSTPKAEFQYVDSVTIRLPAATDRIDLIIGRFFPGGGYSL